MVRGLKTSTLVAGLVMVGIVYRMKDREKRYRPSSATGSSDLLSGREQIIENDRKRSVISSGNSGSDSIYSENGQNIYFTRENITGSSIAPLEKVIAKNEYPYPEMMSERQQVHPLSAYQRIQQGRRKRVDGACARDIETLSLVTERALISNRLVYYPNHKIAFCQIYKVGSTNFNRFLDYVLLDQWKKYLSPYDIPLNKLVKTRLNSLSLTENAQPLNSSLKFLFVREPYKRIFSGYVDKFVFVDSYTWNLLGKDIIRKYRQDANVKSLRCGHDVRFSELIKYIIDGVKSGNLNVHFTPYHENCWPCQIKYDVIGKVETLTDDMEYIWRKANETQKLHGHLPDLNGTQLASVDEKVDFIYKYKHLYGKCTSLNEARNVTWKVLQMRGILGNNVSLPYKKEEIVKMKALRDTVHEAYRKSGSKDFRRQCGTEALIEAYRTVPMEDLLQLQDILRTDCEMFGYDPAPKYIFERHDT